MDKNEIDKQAEQEAQALHKVGQGSMSNYKRIRLQRDDETYNKQEFDKLFKD